MSLSSDVKQYLYNLIGTQLKGEIDLQYDAWIGPGSYVAQLGDAQDKAAANQLQILKQAEDEKKKAFERTMFILSLVSGPVLSWAAGYLQYTLAPRIFYKTVFESSGRSKVLLPKNYEDKIAGKVFGDLGKDLAKVVDSSAVSAVLAKVPAGTKAPDGTKLANMTDGLTFRTSIENEIKAQKDQTTRECLAIAQAINNSTDFGDLLLSKLRKEQPDVNKLSEKLVEQRCQLMVNQLVNKAREGWAERFPIYGLDPPKIVPNRLVKLFESGIWAIWLLQNNFRASDKSAGGKPQWRPVIGDPRYNGDFLSKTIALHINEFTGLQQLALQYTNDEPFTFEAIENLRKWAENQAHQGPAPMLQGTKRQLRPIESYF